MPRRTDVVDIGLVSLMGHYKEQYGEDLVAFAKGEIKVDGLDELTLKLFPLKGLLVRYNFTEDLLRRWLGIWGNNPRPHFVKCNKIAKEYSRLWLDDANIRGKLDFKKYAAYMYSVYGEVVEPPKQLMEEKTIQKSEKFLCLTTEAQ